MQDDEPRDGAGAAPGGASELTRPTAAEALPRVTMVGVDLLQRLAAGLANADSAAVPASPSDDQVPGAMQDSAPDASDVPDLDAGSQIAADEGARVEFEPADEHRDDGLPCDEVSEPPEELPHDFVPSEPPIDGVSGPVAWTDELSDLLEGVPPATGTSYIAQDGGKEIAPSLAAEGEVDETGALADVTSAPGPEAAAHPLVAAHTPLATTSLAESGGDDRAGALAVAADPPPPPPQPASDTSDYTGVVTPEPRFTSPGPSYPLPPLLPEVPEPLQPPASLAEAVDSASVADAPGDGTEVPSLEWTRAATPVSPSAEAGHSLFDVRPGEPWLSHATRAPAEAVAAAPAPAGTAPSALAAAAGDALTPPPPSHRADMRAAAQAPAATRGPRAAAPATPTPTPTRRSFQLRELARQTARFVVIGFAIWLATSVAAIGLFRFVDPPGSMLMLSHRISGDSVDQRWVDLSAISPQVVRAVVASEDGRFCRHWGIDPREILAAIERARNGVPRGASTITMQVAKNLFLWPSKSYLRKALEVPLTLGIELLWPKARTLEVYLNIAEWGPGVFGIEAAARYHFNKPARSLTRSEAALLAVSLPNPISRDAGDPGGGLRRLARIIESRVLNDPGAASCVIGIGR